MKIKKLYREYKEAQERTNKLEELMLEDFENEALEEEFDEAYNAEFKLLTAVVDEVVNLIKIERKTAHAMVVGHAERFEEILSQVA